MYWNPYGYVGGNPVNYTDPSGECVMCFAVYGLSVAWGLVAGAFVVDAGSQFVGGLLDNNSAGEALSNVDTIGSWSRGFEFGVTWYLGYITGGVIGGLNPSIAPRLVRGVLGATADIGFGVGWDMAVHGESFGSSFFWNTAFFGAGELVGRGIARNVDTNTNVCRNSFSEDTTVQTPEGDIPISEIEIGDTVMAYNELTGEIDEYEVTATISHVDEVIIHLYIDDELIETTPEHPFYTDAGEWVDAEHLEVGDQIWSLDGDYGTVESVIVIQDADQRMYNLTVEEAHTFYVGDGDWLVHNTNAICTLPNYTLDVGPGHHLQELSNLSNQYGRVVAIDPAIDPIDDITRRFVAQHNYHIEMISSNGENPFALLGSTIALGGNIKASRLVSIYPQPGSRGTTRGIAGAINHHLGSGMPFYVTAEHVDHYNELITAIHPFGIINSVNNIIGTDFASGRNFLNIPFPRNGKIDIFFAESGQTVRWPYMGHQSSEIFEIIGVRR